jgi:hypothetical protein
MIDARLSSLLGQVCVSSLSGSLGQCRADAVQAGRGGFLEGVLPDADNFPALAAELTGDTAVAGHVVFAFAVPELPVGFRARIALWAAVPETSIDEDSDLLLGKGKVGLSKQGKMPPPAGDFVLPQQCE